MRPEALEDRRHSWWPVASHSLTLGCWFRIRQPADSNSRVSSSTLPEASSNRMTVLQGGSGTDEWWVNICKSSLSRSALCSVGEVLGVLGSWPEKRGQASQSSGLLWFVSVSQEFLSRWHSCVRLSSSPPLAPAALLSLLPCCPALTPDPSSHRPISTCVLRYRWLALPGMTSPLFRGSAPDKAVKSPLR